MENSEQIIKVGVGVMVFKDGKVLMGKRKGKHGSGEYAWPGGHLEYMESFVDCAKREVFEECGIKIKNIRFLRLLNMKKYNKHYVDIAMVSEWESGELELKEPEKCEGWDWYEMNKLPQPVFAPIETFLITSFIAIFLVY